MSAIVVAFPNVAPLTVFRYCQRRLSLVLPMVAWKPQPWCSPKLLSSSNKVNKTQISNNSNNLVLNSSSLCLDVSFLNPNTSQHRHPQLCWEPRARLSALFRWVWDELSSYHIILIDIDSKPCFVFLCSKGDSLCSSPLSLNSPRASLGLLLVASSVKLKYLRTTSSFVPRKQMARPGQHKCSSRVRPPRQWLLRPSKCLLSSRFNKWASRDKLLKWHRTSSPKCNPEQCPPSFPLIPIDQQARFPLRPSKTLLQPRYCSYIFIIIFFCLNF